MAFKLKLIAGLAGLLALVSISFFTYVKINNLNKQVDELTAEKNKLKQELVEKELQSDLDNFFWNLNMDSLKSLNNSLKALKQTEVKVTEYVVKYKNNPANTKPCLRSEWMQVYNYTIETAFDKGYRF